MTEQFVEPDITGDLLRDIDITGAGDSTTVGGVIIQDAANVGSGTGGYNTFLAIADNNDAGDFEVGLNTDDSNPLDGTNKEIDPSKTHTVLLSGIPITIGTGTGPGGNGGVLGVAYYEIRVDLNESNNTPSTQISLDQFKLYANSSNLIENTAALGAPVYDMDATSLGNISILLSEAGSSGSGTDDYSFLVPASLFGNANPATTYLYMFVEMGHAGADWISNGGFEEFNLQNAVTLNGTKFSDGNSDGIKNGTDAGVGGVTVFIDTDKDGVLDATERFTTTDAQGNYSFYGVAAGTYQIDEVNPAGSAQTTGAFETVTVPTNITTGQIILIDPIGNHYFLPRIAIDKAFVNITDGPDAGTASTTVINGAGDIANYTIAVTNTGETALTGVTLTDALADAGSLTLVSNGNGDNILDIGETWTYTARQTATQADLDTNGGGDSDKDNSATVVATQQGTATTVTATDTAAAPILPAASLAITKVFDGYTGGDGDSLGDTAGDIANYTIVVTNTGNQTLTGVVATDPLTGANVPVGTLAPGQSFSFVEQYVVTQADLDGGGVAGSDHDIDNTASADSDQTGPASASATAPLVYDPEFSVVKTATSITGGVGLNGLGGADTAGDVVNYAITIANTGNVTLTGFTYSDTNSDGDIITYVSGDSDIDGKLDVGETWNYSATHTVTQAELDSPGTGGTGLLDFDGDTDNTVTVDFNETSPLTGNASTPLTYAPSLAIDKVFINVTGGDGDTLADAVGDVLHYTVSVTNTGNVTLTNVTVTDPLTGQAITGVTLAPGATGVYNTSYTLTQADLDRAGNAGSDGDIDNTATADSDQTGPASDSAEVPLVYDPKIAIDKVFINVTGGNGNGVADVAGDVINYSIVVTNTGNVTLTNVTVKDPLTGLDVNAGTLAPGASVTLNEHYTVSQADLDGQGGGDGDVDNTATADSDQTPPSEDKVEVPLVYAPSLNIVKDVSSITGGVAGKADSAGDVINYAISVQNTGNISLTGVVVTDPNADAGSIHYVSGDTDTDGVLDVGETWNYTATHLVTQAELNTRGGGDGDIDNIATVNSAQTGPDSDDAEALLVYNPKVDLEKLVSIDGVHFIDADTAAAGFQNVAVQSSVFFQVVVANTGNIDLTNVVITDINTTGGTPGSTITLFSGGSLQLAGATMGGDTDHDGVLDVGETWTINYTQGFDLGQHINTAYVTDLQGATDNDAAYYYGIQAGPGVRTPGFWSNLGAQFWDNIANNQTKVGPTFADHELVYAVDSNNDGVINSSDRVGLLIGDFNKNGLRDAGEDVLFINLADAKQVINASQRTMSGDGVQMLGRDVVATWLNYLAGNPIGGAADTNSPTHFIEDAVDWLQTFAGVNGGTSKTELWDVYAPGHTAVRTNSAAWNTPQFAGDPHSASQMHSALDGYNNTGDINGVQYAMSADDPNDVLLILAAHSTP